MIPCQETNIEVSVFLSKSLTSSMFVVSIKTRSTSTSCTRIPISGSYKKACISLLNREYEGFCDNIKLRTKDGSCDNTESMIFTLKKVSWYNNHLLTCSNE